MDAVWSLKLDNEGERLVLLALADNANDEGTHCFPSQRRIAWKTGLTVKSVSAIIARLEKKGLVEILNKGNQHRPTNYALHFEKGIQKETFVPSSWAGDKVKSTQTEVQLNSVTGELHFGESEMHPEGSELHLHESELHLDATKTKLNCGQQTTSASQPSVYPSGYQSGETHDPAKTAAAAPDAPGASAKAVEKSAVKEDVKNEPAFPATLPYWMQSTKGLPGVVFAVPQLKKFDGPHPRAIFRIGDVTVKVWEKRLITKLEATHGKLLAVWGKWTEYKGQKEFVVTAISRQSAEDIAAIIEARSASLQTEPAVKADKPQPVPASILSENHPDVIANVVHMRKFPHTREDLEAIVKDKLMSPVVQMSARILLAEMPAKTKPPAPSCTDYIEECPF
jgi:hypothetical protein